MSRRVLLITTRFPPGLGVGGLRYKGLATYLPDFGWEPIVLTETLPEKPDERFNVIQFCYPGNVFKRLKRKLGVSPNKKYQERIETGFATTEKRSLMDKLLAFLSYTVLRPNKYRGLCLYFILASRDVLRTENIDAIISCSRVTHVAANELKRDSKLPWIADFRDLWTQNHYFSASAFEKWCEKKLELKTLSKANALVTVSKPLAEELKTLHKGKVVFSIPSGFDPEEVKVAKLTKEFTITYAGGFCGGKRDPRLLFQALQKLIAEGIINPSVVRINFFGPFQNWLQQEIRQYKIEGIVEQCGIVSRQVILAKERESQLLLLLNWNNPKEHGVYTGKVFEYLATRRPILAFGGPKGVVSILMQETGAGVHVSNLASLKKALANYYKQYENTGQVIYRGKEKSINKYSHFEMARKFAKTLDLVTG